MCGGAAVLVAKRIIIQMQNESPPVVVVVEMCSLPAWLAGMSLEFSVHMFINAKKHSDYYWKPAATCSASSINPSVVHIYRQFRLRVLLEALQKYDTRMKTVELF